MSKATLRLTLEDVELLATAVMAQKASASKLKNEYLLSKYGSLLTKIHKQVKL